MWSLRSQDGASLPLDDGAVDNLIMHTVLTHVADPEPLLTEAMACSKVGRVSRGV